MDYQLELIDVAKQYKEFLAVDSVNLQIEKGEIVSFLGASGCGKTTTLRMIAGLIEPTRGTIRIQGRDMNGIPPHKSLKVWKTGCPRNCPAVSSRECRWQEP